MTITVRGKAPAPASTQWDQQTLRLDEDVAWTDLTAALNDLWCDGPRLLQMQRELARLDRNCVSRSAKLDDPRLREHPGFWQARDEFLTWSAAAINRNVEITCLTKELQRQARRADEVWAVLRPELQDAVAQSQRWIGQELLTVIPALGDVQALPAWRFLLTRWRELFAVVPF
jgi:hypothetical protein